MIIIDWLKWKWYTWRYAFSMERDARGKYMVVCTDRWNNQTFRDSKTEEGRDFDNPEVKAWLKRQRKREVK